MKLFDNLAPTETCKIFVGLENNYYEIKKTRINLFCFEDPEHVREESAADKTNSCLGVVQEPGESLKRMFWIPEPQ